MRFSNTYTALDEVFYDKTRPTPVRAPELLLWNAELAEQLMIPDELKGDPVALAETFSGNRILPGSEPIATAYAGHQFGNFVPQLGDGRAHLLGEVLDQSGKRWDIQLKGSGPTVFSRRGDGRCAIGPAVREFIMSEAMNALGIPTTRCLAVVTTGEPVFRESPLPGAVVTRVASSHLRVGTFQYFAARENLQALEALCDYTLERHYPELKSEEKPGQYLRLIETVMERQIQLVTEWMRVGFIHGVMNTDNTSLAGETIDYGPCAMMGSYDPKTVYSSIDTMGRYAFGNQPEIAQWNIYRFAECLLPLIDPDTDRAIERVVPIVSEFPVRFRQAYTAMMGRKLGMHSLQENDESLIASLLERLEKACMDYTITFDHLTESLHGEAIALKLKSELGDWFDRWKKRIDEQGMDSQKTRDLMRQHNPVVIPRNHHVEAVIQECEQTGKTTLAEKFLEVLRTPYELQEKTALFQDSPADKDRYYKTFCGT